MAIAITQPTVSLIAATTFASSSLYKFVNLTTDAQVQVGGTTGAASVVGTLLSVTATTSGAGVETVTVGLLSGVGKVNMAASTQHAGKVISASSAGLGIAPTTDSAQLGYSVSGSSGTTGRIHSVLFVPDYDA